MSKGWWQLIASISLALLALLVAAIVYVVLAYGDNLDALAAGQGVCLANQSDFDSIAAAQMTGRLDFVTFLLTAGGVLLGVFAFIGFWMIRREALDLASDTAADTARQVANQYFGNQNNAGTAGGDNPPPEGHIQGEPPPNPPTPFPIGGVSTEGAKEEKGVSSARSKRRSRGNPGASKKDSGSDGPSGE